MNVRKVIRVGNSWGITLPHEFVNEGVDYIIIEKKNGELVLRPLRVKT